MTLWNRFSQSTIWGAELAFKLGKENGFKIYTFLVFGAVFFWTQYDMEVTSVVTVRDKLMAFKTINEFVENGFRMTEEYCENLSKEYYCGSWREIDWSVMVQN